MSHRKPLSRAHRLATRHRQRAVKHTQPASADDIRLLFWRAKGHCAYCGQRPPDDRLQVEHAHPLSLGGSSAFVNLFPVCQACGSAKGTKSLYAMKTAPELRALHEQFHRAETADEHTLREMVTTAALALDLEPTDHVVCALLLTTLGDLLGRLGIQPEQQSVGVAEPPPLLTHAQAVAQHVLAAAAVAYRQTRRLPSRAA